jgi:hypothetical protein
VHRGRIRALVLTSASLAVLTAVVGGPTGLLVLAVAATALGAAAVLGIRARSTTALPAPARSRTAPTVIPSTVPAGSVDAADLTDYLRRLHDDHVEQVNMAVAEGREDLVQELSDSYMDESLALITGGGRRSPDSFLIQ